MRTPDDGVTLLDDSKESRLPRSRKLFPLGPKAFTVEKAGSGVRITITDRAHESVENVGTGATSYNVYWAADVDMTTLDGVSAGFARATLLAPGIPAPGSDGAEATCFYADPQYLVGYFYCVGVDAQGLQSAPGQPIHLQSGTGGTVPPDVEHFQASESGEVHNGTTLSAVSYSFRIPANGGNIDSVQFQFKNYPNLNETSEGESVRITAGISGTQTGKLMMPIGRRMGTGNLTIAGTNVTTPAGTGNFLSIAAAAGGDQLEVMGVRARILSVTDNDTMTLTGAWTGPTVTAVSQWQTIGAVTIYAVSIGAHGERRDDPQNAPSVTVDMDGDLSAPNAPTLVGVVVGNIIRLEITPGVGTDLSRVLLYRGTGAGQALSACSVIHPFEIDRNNPSPSLQWDDSDFSVYEKEQGQTFSYYAQSINVRDQPSAASARVEVSCRLDSPADGGTTNPARFITTNLLWNGMLSGTAGTVNGADAVQDSNMGGVRPAGHNPWVTSTSGVGSFAAFQNTTEVLLAMTAANAVGTSELKQSIGAWDNATPGARRVGKGKTVTLQMKARHSAGSVNGWLKGEILQWNGAALSGKAFFRKRLSNDTLDLSTNTLIVNGSDLTDVHSLYSGVFVLDDTLTTTDIQVVVFYEVPATGGGWTGVNLAVTEIELSFGDGVPYWSGLIDWTTTYPGPSGGAPTPPGQFTDMDGHGREFSRLP